uniref:Uncharacterized protein n=1 Tax=Romanomermis culicivorax TaxID=13658 RepID=A0A915KEX5_ROMCU
MTLKSSFFGSGQVLWKKSQKVAHSGTCAHKRHLAYAFLYDSVISAFHFLSHIFANGWPCSTLGTINGEPLINVDQQLTVISHTVLNSIDP